MQSCHFRLCTQACRCSSVARPASQVTEASITKACGVFRPVAVRGSLLYFLVDSLSSLDRVYHYSMANFVAQMVKSMVSEAGCWALGGFD